MHCISDKQDDPASLWLKLRSFWPKYSGPVLFLLFSCPNEFLLAVGKNEFGLISVPHMLQVHTRCTIENVKRGLLFDGAGHSSETGRIRFRGVRFQTPNSVSFFGLTEFRGASSVSSSQSSICVQKRTHRVFLQNSPSLPQNSVRLSESSSPKQYSRNSIPPVS